MENKRADFTYWDTIEGFTLTEAAWLWCELEPPYDGIEFMPTVGNGIPPHPVIKDLPARGQHAARAMWQDITQNRLIILTDWPDTRYKIPRKYLRLWAEERGGYKPLFLFQELRDEKQSDLSLEGALMVIAALVKLAQPQRDPDKRSYGLIPKIEQAGCNLEKKTIGKYLNSAKKIKNIG